MRERSNKQPNLNESSKTSFSKKVKKFLENSEKAVTHVLAKMGIASSLVGGTMATEATTATFIPEAVATITTITPTTSAAVKTITIGTAIALASACDRPDITPPTAEVVNRDVNISGGEALRISGNQVYIGNNLVFRCSDDVSTNLNISVTFNGKPISSGFVFNEGGTISGKATDEAGNQSSNASSKINLLNNAPTIDLKQSQVDVSKEKVVSFDSSKLVIGGETIATWSDDKTQNCKVSLTLDGKEVKSGDTLDKEGTLILTVTDGDGKSSTVNIKLNVVNNAPTIDLKQSQVDVSKPKVVSIESNKLTIGGDVIATWSDDKTQNCTVSLTLDGKEVKSGDTLDKEGTLILTVTDGDGKSSSVNIKLNVVNNAPSIDLKQAQINIYGEIQITISGNKLLLGSEEIASRSDDRTENCTVSIKFNNKEVKSGDVINETGTLSITVTDGDGKSSTKEISIENQSITINNIKPVDILPIIGQVQEGDKECYSHIEHLRIAEATRIRDMMWKYGAGNYSPEQYQQLMSRLNTGLRAEIPSGYSNYEIIGQQTYQTPSDHAHAEYSILNTLIKHTNIKILLHDPQKPNRQQTMIDYINEHPNTINIFGSSNASVCTDKKLYDERIEKDIIDLCNSKQFLMFSAGTNIESVEGVFKNKIYNGEYKVDNKGIYSMIGSLTNSDKNTKPKIHLLVTIGTNSNGDVNQTNETQYGSSKYPVGFANNVLFSGRTFPYDSSVIGAIAAEDGKYATSITNYTNVAIMDLCFQMFAEVKDVDELLEMVRSTCDTDYIRLDGQTQELQLMNPAKFFKKYLMPKNIPSSISAGKTIPLEKGYYKGVVFAMPGAEVKINGQWVEYSKENESLIKSQNPMTLEWRLNGDLVAKYNKNGTVTGKVIAVDDQRNGLNLDMEGITVKIQNIAGINGIGVGNTFILTNILNQGPVYDIPSSIHPGETIMLSSLSNKGVIYDIPGAQPYIKGKSWVEYNDENKALVQAQDLKNTLWRLNGDIAMKESKDGCIRGRVYTLNDKGNIIDNKEVAIRVERSNIQNNNYGYIADNYIKDEGMYVKEESNYNKNEGSYLKEEGKYTKKLKYNQNEGNYKKNEMG